MWIVSLFAWGISQQVNSTPSFISVVRKPTLRARRSSLATISLSAMNAAQRKRLRQLRPL
jgi:hypothetical protein